MHTQCPAQWVLSGLACTRDASRGNPVRQSKPASTTCSISTSFATLPASFTPRLRYLQARHEAPFAVHIRSMCFTALHAQSAACVQSHARYLTSRSVRSAPAAHGKSSSGMSGHAQHWTQPCASG